MEENIKSTVAFISSDHKMLLGLKRLFVHSINMNIYKNNPNSKWIGNFFACVLKEEFNPNNFICKANVEDISSIYNPIENKYCFIIKLEGDYPPIYALEQFIGELFKKKIEISYSLEYKTVGENVMDQYFYGEDEEPQIIYSSDTLN